MKHIRSWQERVNEGDSIFAKATALEAEVAELRELIHKAYQEAFYALSSPTPEVLMTKVVGIMRMLMIRPPQ